MPTWDVMTCRRDRPDVALFVGSGKAEEIGQHAKALDAGLVIFNHSLSPVQQRNLEQVVHGRVIDRTSLILDIFALRAQSAEGKLQVVKMNVDENTEVPGKYGVMSIPMFLIVNKGEVVDSFVGSKPKEDVVAKLKAVLPQ